MKPIYIKLVFDRKKKAKSTKPAAIELRLTQDRVARYVATGIQVLPRQWHDGQVVNRIDAAELQQSLELMLKNVRQTINSLVEKDGECSLDALVVHIRNTVTDEVSFLDFCAQRIDVRTYGRSKDSRERYERFLKYMINFGKFSGFEDVNDANILAMDADLGKRMKPYSKWQNYHRILNSFILDAIDAGHMTRNPYRWLNIQKEKSSGGIGKYLTMEEFCKLRDMELPTDSLRRVRDLFVFQTYTCLSYVDMANFDAKQIRYVKDRPIYTSHRGKTKQEFTFLILPPAMAILKKYKNKLPIISNEKYNDYLKVVALMGEIDKPISSHWARHTGATMLLNEGGVPMEIVAKILGHSSTKITRQVYAKLLDETIADAMEDLDI